MADLFSVTAPLVLRHPNGNQHVLAERFPHPDGMLFFELFWHLGTPEQTVHLVRGPLKGEGPWKIGEAVVRVLGCHGTDAPLARQFEEWRQYLSENADAYPPRAVIEAIARHHAAVVTAGPGLDPDIAEK